MELALLAPVPHMGVLDSGVSLTPACDDAL